MIWQMKVFKREFFIVLGAVILAGYEIEASTYNYSASIECLPNPLAPQYEGGLVANPKFDKGLEGWGVFGHGTIEVRKSRIGNQFIVAKHRTQPHDSFSQWLHLQEGNYYTFLAWVQINEGKETVVAAFRNFHDQKMVVGSIIAQCGCWSMLKGGFSADQTMSFELYFESNNTNIELWVDNISLQPFTKSQWREHQFQSIEKVRKRKLVLHVTNKQGKKLEGAKITIKQTKPYFPLGCAIAETILENKSYQKWFTSRFPATTFDNEMKWYFTEKTRGHENYTTADAMLAFFKRHGISVRGHNIFWDNPMQNLLWVRSLSPEELVDASVSRIVSLMLRYAGKVIAWDVMNENLHFSFFEDRIGENASSILYSFAQELDPVTTMFMNEYNTLEYPEDLRATPSKYIEKIKEIKGYKGTEIKVVGIGLQGHFGKPNIPYVRACLDVLGTTNMPIWLTELDVKRGPHQAEYLEEIMREAYSHPAVQGIIVWSGWKPTGCSNMCLTDNNFENLPTGDVVDKLLREWKTENLKGITNEIGVYEHQVFHGDYFVTIFDPYTRKKITRKLKVTKEKTEAFNVRIHL